MAMNLITSLLSLGTEMLPSIRTSAHAPSSSSNSNNSEKGRAVEEDLEGLMRTLKLIKATLYDAEEREIRDRFVKLWLKELKKVAYDAEDVLSEYRYEVTRLQVEARKACQASSSHKREQMEYIVPIPDGMVDGLNKIRSQFDEIAKARETLQLRESDGVRRLNNRILRIPTGHMVDEVSIFGRDAEVEEVISLLLSENEVLFSVISIVGKGGLGKTTLAQLVYKKLRDSQCFHLFGWICVSEEFDVGKLIRATIESLSKIYNGVSELSPLQEELAKTVRGKTILLVLDDVWNENQSLWELFQIPFKEAKMVRILVTTRNKKVAEVMQTTTFFRPTNLPEDSCWQLFQHYAFCGTSDTMRTHLTDMGRDIMTKCGGLPLAVKSIASLLRHETDEESWREILESDLWKSNPSNDIFPALQISYAHLPAHLKPCFLFCSMYPKDYILEKMNLIELWISHGYIESRGKRRITEIGIEYYEELKGRSFFDDVEYYKGLQGRSFVDDDEYYEEFKEILDDCSNESSKYCKLHDIIHDLARLNSENEHYSVEINQQFDLQEENIPREAYHLYVRGFVVYVNQILQQNLKSLRTLSTDLEHQNGINNTEAMNLAKLSNSGKCIGDEANCDLTKFEALRVLELKGYSLTKIPDSILELRHLAHLGITSSHLKMLPLSIGLLYNLQTLILDCFSLEYLPENIGDLANLHFLNILSSRVKKLPESLCSLSNLVRLFIRSNHLQEVPLDLKNLSNLRELTICSKRIQAFPNTIDCLSGLQELNMLPLAGSFDNLPDKFNKDNKDNGKLFYVPHGLINFPAMKTMTAQLRVRSIAWLKDMKDLKGKLSIKGLENISNLVDVQRAHLRNKCKLETLHLWWDSEMYIFPSYYEKAELRLSIIPEACEGGLVGTDDVDFSLLECLQPHPNLKKLEVRGYNSATIPRWMTDPFFLKSIQEILLECCENIQSLQFHDLHTLKCLNIRHCNSIQFLQLEQLSSQIEKLQIISCGHLELITGLGDLNMLAALEIKYCQALKSLTMDGLQSVKSTEPFGDSSHEKPHIGRQRMSSLTRLYIIRCDFLSVLPDELIPSGPCYVHVWGCSCPDLQIGCHNK